MNDLISLRKKDRAALIAELEKAGTVFKGNSCRCPYHEDNHPSAGIYQTDAGDWRFKCQSCGLNLDVWDVQARNEGKDTPELLKSIVGKQKASRSYANSKPEQQSRVFATIEDISELFTRTIGEIIAVYKYSNPDTKAIELLVFRILTSTGKTFRQARPCNGGYELKSPDAPRPIYNRSRVKSAGTVIVVEGEKDVHSLNDYGIVATCSPCGAGNADKADWSLLAGKNVIIWPDNDAQGFVYQNAVITILKQLEPTVRISVIDPANLDLQEKEDCSDFIDQCKIAGIDVKNALFTVLQQAKAIGARDDLRNHIESVISGRFRSIDLPFTQTMRLTNAIIPNTVTLICGSPGASKSLMMLQLLAFWLEIGVKACVYELEEDKTFHLMRALAQTANCAGLTDPGWISENPEHARDLCTAHGEFIERLSRCIWSSPETQQTYEQLMKWAEERAKANYRVICIDPITAAAQTGKPWVEDNHFMQSAKKIATDYKCSIVLVTHPKAGTSAPDMNQLAGGQSFSRFAQTILWLEAHEPKESEMHTICGRAKDTHNRTLHILKARNGKGQGANLAFEFNDNLSLSESGIIIKKKGKN